MSARSSIILLGLAMAGLSLLVACGTDRASQVEQRSTTNVNDAYRPVYGNRGTGTTDARGSIRGDFQWAAAAPTVADAVPRWEAFLKTHNPPGQEFEDNLHASYVAAAQYELIRAYYLAGRRADGDALLRWVDPVGWAR